MITPLGLVFTFLGLFSLLLGNRKLLLILGAISIPFMQHSALGVAGGVVTPFYVVSAFALLFLLQDRLRSAGTTLHAERGAHRGLAWLFLVYVIATGVLLPNIFRETYVTPARLEFAGQLVPLRFSWSAIGQVAFAGLSATFILFCMRSIDIPRKYFDLAMTSATILNSWAWLHEFYGLPLPTILWHRRGAISLLGDGRFSGLYSEPAFLGVITVAAFVFFLVSTKFSRGGTRLRYIVLATINAAFIVGAESASVSLAVFAILFVYICVSIRSVIFRRKLVNPMIVAAVFLSLPLLATLFLRAISFLFDILTYRLATQSFVIRNDGNQQIFRILTETYGFGVGLGSNRPYSLLATLVSNIGIIGLCLSLVLSAFFTFWLMRTRRLAELWTLVAIVSMMTVGIGDPAMSVLPGSIAFALLGYSPRAASVECTKITKRVENTVTMNQSNRLPFLVTI